MTVHSVANIVGYISDALDSLESSQEIIEEVVMDEVTAGRALGELDNVILKSEALKALIKVDKILFSEGGDPLDVW